MSHVDLTHIFYEQTRWFEFILSVPDMANLSLNDNDGSSGASDQDTLAPLPLPGTSPWPMMHTFPYQPYPTHPYSSQPPPYHELTSYSYAPGSTGSQHSEGERTQIRLQIVCPIVSPRSLDLFESNRK